MKKDDFEYLLGLLKQHAGWDLGEDKFFILDRKIYNFVREKDYASVEDLIADLHQGQKPLLWLHWTGRHCARQRPQPQCAGPVQGRFAAPSG